MEKRFVAGEQNPSKKWENTARKSENKNTHQKVKMLELQRDGLWLAEKKKQKLKKNIEKQKQKCQNKNS